jgi:hypothetical protein
VRITSALVGVCLLVTSCSGPVTSSTPEPAATVTVTATATATVTATPSPEQSDVSDRELVALGEKWTGEYTTTQALEYRRNISAYGAEQGSRWDAVLVKSCVNEDAPTDADSEGVTFSWSPWTLQDGDSGRYPASSSTYENFPKPEFPFAGDETFRRGDCVKGWIVFSIPGGAAGGERSRREPSRRVCDLASALTADSARRTKSPDLRMRRPTVSRKLPHVFRTDSRKPPDLAGHSRTTAKGPCHANAQVTGLPTWWQVQWQVQDSNLRRHTPTDLQNEAGQLLTCMFVARAWNFRTTSHW